VRTAARACIVISPGFAAKLSLLPAHRNDAHGSGGRASHPGRNPGIRGTLAARAGHGLAIVGCSDEFGFVRPRRWMAGGDAALPWLGFVRQPGSGPLVQCEQARSLGSGMQSAARVRSAREIGSPGCDAACCRGSGSFGALARVGWPIGCDVATRSGRRLIVSGLLTMTSASVQRVHVTQRIRGAPGRAGEGILAVGCCADGSGSGSFVARLESGRGAACCRGSGSFGTIARVRRAIRCNVETKVWQAADRLTHS
jgi:hypothetical protein